MEPLSQPLATYEDLRAYPKKVRAEVVARQVHVLRSPLPRQQSNAGCDPAKQANLPPKHDRPHDWIIDPAERVLEASSKHEGAWTSADAARIAPFDAIELPLSRLFPPEPE